MLNTIPAGSDGSGLVSIPAGELTGALPAIDGSSLTGIDATALKDSGGNVKAQANPNGVVVTGVLTATSFSGDGSNLSGLSLSKDLTIGVRTGAAVTFSLTGSSFNVINRAGGNVAVNI